MNEIKKEIFIKDLKAGDNVEEVFAIADKKIRKKKNGDDYCLMTLQDSSGKIDAVIWTELFNQNRDLHQGDFVSVEGQIQSYRNSIQLTVSRIFKIENEEDIDYSDFVLTVKRDIDEMLSELNEYINSVKNEYLKKLLGEFFDDKVFVKSFCRGTAAIQYHHAYSGGLLEHTLSVTKICSFLAENYENVDRDILLTGAILHDIGKLEEYKTGAVNKVTDSGKLLGHITIGYGWILEKADSIKDFPEELKHRLLHIILSHHGHLEYGSPKQPKTIEAFMVYHADHLDADINGFNIIAERNRGENSWSDFVRNFDRSIFLKTPEYDDYGMAKINEEESITNDEKKSDDKKQPPQDGLFE